SDTAAPAGQPPVESAPILAPRAAGPPPDDARCRVSARPAAELPAELRERLSRSWGARRRARACSSAAIAPWPPPGLRAGAGHSAGVHGHRDGVRARLPGDGVADLRPLQQQARRADRRARNAERVVIV